MRATGVITGAAILLGAAPAAAQRELTVAPLVSLAEHRVAAGFGVERSLGPIVGGVGTVRFSPRLAVAVRALGGSLFGAKGVLDRDVGELGVEGHAQDRDDVRDAGFLEGCPPAQGEHAGGQSASSVLTATDPPM